MKYLLIIALLISACGKENPLPDIVQPEIDNCEDSVLTGSWHSIDNPQTIVFNPDCTFSDNLCGMGGNFKDKEKRDGTLEIVFSHGNCVGEGTYIFNYSVDSSALGLAATIQGVLYSDAYLKE